VAPGNSALVEQARSNAAAIGRSAADGAGARALLSAPPPAR
jgi:hypothetical protein